MQTDCLIPERSLPVEPWFSPRLRARLAGRSVAVEVPRPLKKALRVVEKIPVSDWAEINRIVTAIDSSPGPWRPDLVPHAKKIMDAYSQPWVEEVWVCAVERAAKTNIMLNCMGWAIDCDPGNIFYLMPTEDAAGKTIGRKIIPMLEASPRLSGYLGRRQDDTTKTLIGMNHGMSLFPAHANSASSMAAFYGKHCFGDEVDKYPERTGKEADPITLIRKRGRDRRGSKRMFCSTPAQKFIWKGVQACHQIWERELLCPDCGDYFIPLQEHIIIPQDVCAEDIERGAAEVNLVCPCCGTLMDEAKRAAAYRWGRDVVTKGADVKRPKRVGFHLPAWGLPTVPLTEIAAAILRARSGDLAAKIALANGYAATDYVQELSDRKEDQILRLRDERPEGIVPSWADTLTLHADTQDDGFWYSIRAWKYGADLKSGLVKHGFVQTLYTLEELIFKTDWLDFEGKAHRIGAAIIDTGGHRTAEVYEWCRRTGVFAAKGASGRKTQPVTVSRIDFFPGTNKAIPGGLMLYNLDVHFAKDALAIKLQSDPVVWHLHSGYSADQLKYLDQHPGEKLAHSLESYAKHFCAEGRDEKKMWQNPQNKANHLWDCEVYGLALALYLGFQNRKSEKDAKVQLPEPVRDPVPAGKGRLPNWFMNRGR